MLITLNNNMDISIDDAFERFISSCIVKNLRPHSIIYYKNSWKMFKGFTGDIELVTINKDLIERYILYLRKDNTRNDETINNKLRGIRVILYYFMNEEYIKHFKINTIKSDTPQKETYTENELKILLNKPNIKQCTFVEYRTWVIVNFLISTGARLSTLLSIKIEDLNFEDELITYNYTKTRKKQIVPMSNTLKGILKEYLTVRKGNVIDYLFCSINGFKLAPRVLQDDVKKYNNERGIVRTSIHAFRHTYAKMWVISGGNMFSLQRLLGHTTLEMTKQYVNLYSNDLKINYNEFNPLEKLNKQNVNIRMRRD